MFSSCSLRCSFSKQFYNNRTFEYLSLNETFSEVKYKCSIQINSRFNSFFINISCLVVPQIITGNLPNFRIDANCLRIPDNRIGRS